MDHDWALAGAVFIFVFDVETLGKIEVDLNGGELPTAADGIADLDVDLGSIEGRFAGDAGVVEAFGFEGLDKAGFGEFPHVVGADVLVGAVFVTDAEVDFEFGETERAEDEAGDIEGGSDFVGELIGTAEDVGVVLGESANAEGAVEDAGALKAIDGAQLTHANGQVAVAAGAGTEDLDVEGAVHRLVDEGLVLELHLREEAIGVPAGVAAGFPEFFAADVGGEDDVVAALAMLGAPEIFDDFSKHAAFGMPEDETGAYLGADGEEVEFAGEGAVVATEGLFALVEVFLEVLLGRKGGGVDALQLGALFVALPVGPGDGEQLVDADAAGVGDVGPGAEIEEVAGAVDGDGFAGGGKVADCFDFVGLASVAEELEGVVAGYFFVNKRIGGFSDGPHALFDLLEIFGGQRPREIEVVVETGVDGRAETKLRVGEDLLDGGGHHMGARVAHGFEFGHSHWVVSGVIVGTGGGCDRTRSRRRGTPLSASRLAGAASGGDGSDVGAAD